MIQPWQAVLWRRVEGNITASVQYTGEGAYQCVVVGTQGTFVHPANDYAEAIGICDEKIAEWKGS